MLLVHEYTSCAACEAPQRHPGCHDTCEGYQAAKAQHDARHAKIREAKAKAFIGIRPAGGGKHK